MAYYFLYLPMWRNNNVVNYTKAEEYLLKKNIIYDFLRHIRYFKIWV